MAGVAGPLRCRFGTAPADRWWPLLAQSQSGRSHMRSPGPQAGRPIGRAHGLGSRLDAAIEFDRSLRVGNVKIAEFNLHLKGIKRPPRPRTMLRSSRPGRRRARLHSIDECVRHGWGGSWSSPADSVKLVLGQSTMSSIDLAAIRLHRRPHGVPQSGTKIGTRPLKLTGIERGADVAGSNPFVRLLVEASPKGAGPYPGSAREAGQLLGVFDSQD